MLQGCDYAFSHPDPKGLYAAGMRFAMRYIGDGTEDKQLHVAERDGIWAAGMSIVLLCEGTTSEALAGYSKGREQAQQCLADMATLGVPDTVPVYFAADTDLVTAGQFAAIADFCHGAADVMGGGRVGMYGEYDCMTYLAQHAPQWCRWFFQTYAWSGQKWYSGNNVEQYRNGVALAGGEVDLCRSKTDNFGQWEDDDMTVTDDQVAAIWNFIENGERPVKPDTVTPPGYEGMPNNWLGAQVAMAQQDAARAYAGVLELQKQLVALANAIAGIQVGGAHTHSVTGETGPAVAAP